MHGDCRKTGLLGKVLGAASDQVMLSIVNLAVSVALIRLGTKADYGLYTLMLGAIYFLQGIQNALLISPFATRLGVLEKDRSSDAYKALYWGQLVFISIASVSGVVCTYIAIHYFRLDGKGALPLVFGVALAGWLMRDWSRSVQYACGNVRRALVGNAVYSVALMTSVCYGLFSSSLELPVVFAAIGAGGVLSAVRCLINIPSPRGSMGEIKEFWLLARWALFGVLLTWINSNFYPYLVAEKFGLNMVGELNAARLFLMPFGVLVPAWGSLFRPIVIRWFSESRIFDIRRIIYSSVICGSTGVVGYGLVLFAFYDEVAFLAGSEYGGLGELILCWSFYYLFFVIRNILQTIMFVDESGYRRLAQNSFFAFLGFLPAMYLGLHFGVAGIVIALGCIEALQAFSVFIMARKYLSDSPERVAAATI